MHKKTLNSFFYIPNASEQSLHLDTKTLHHIHVRRQKVGDHILCVNFKDDFIYTYKILSMSRSKTMLELIKSTQSTQKQNKKVSLAWAFTSTKTIEKTLPFLNECFIDKLFLLPTHRSQNMSLNHDRMKEIIINSSCQCGRLDLMEIEVFSSLLDFAKTHAFSYLDFGGSRLENKDFDTPILVGPQGGFCEKDYEILQDIKKLALPSELVLQSHTAITALASRAMFV